MCYTQIVHHCCHADQISFHADERERHVCDLPCWSYNVGYKCPAHSCCWIVLEMDVFSCDERQKDGTCRNMMEDEVFVQEEEDEEVEQKEKKNYAEQEKQKAATEIEGEEDEVCMEFWPEDQEGKAVLVFLEDEDVDNNAQ
ncbi:hypothetical protein PG993_004485 [Apiospora rasikravindrae]|uniref:Uncharacterized protein n=1 Tax=Apiospora rasikravindrae TaxID=990691 RepID=A0ABR1TCW2_9PEZI